MGEYIRGRKRHLNLAWVFTLCIGLLACGSSATKKPQAASPVAREVPILVMSNQKTGKTKRVVGLVARVLRQKGYQVVVEEHEPHAVIAMLATRKVKKKTFGTLRINGKAQESFETKAVIRVTAGSEHLGGKTITLPDGKVKTGDVAPLARVVVGTAFKQFAARYVEKNEKLAKAKEAEQKAEAAAEAKAALALYQATQPDDCAAPTTPDDCKALEAFLDEHPDSPHAEEARETLDEGRPRIAKLIDDNAWKAAKVGACQLPETSQDCNGVKTYLNEFPSGAHAKEAGKLLEKQGPTIAKLDAEEKTKRCDDGDAVACQLLGNHEKACTHGSLAACIKTGNNARRCKLDDLEGCIAAENHQRACELLDVASCKKVGDHRGGCIAGDQDACDRACKGGDKDSCLQASAEVRETATRKNGRTRLGQLLPQCISLRRKAIAAKQRARALARQRSRDAALSAKEDFFNWMEKLADVRSKMKDAFSDALSGLMGDKRVRESRQLRVQYGAPRCPTVSY